MATSSRWTRWVITESANPRIMMPWAVTGRVRHGTGRAAVPAGMLATGLGAGLPSLQPGH